jgi:hypothetical protein
LAGQSVDLPRGGVLATGGATGQRSAVSVVGSRNVHHPAGDDRPVLVRRRRHQHEDLPDGVDRRERVVDGPQILTGRTQRQAGVEPVTQQPRTAPLQGVF